MSTRTNCRYFPLFALTFGLLTAGLAGCHSSNQNPTSSNAAQAQNATATQAADESQDPAEQANLAPSEAAPEQQAAPPPPADQASDYSYNAPEADESEAEEPVTYAPDPPPPLPEYDQPEAPGPDYLWTPGYWDYANTGYYWVPGTWVLAPYVGALWTPGYWGFYGGRYLWHRGYWGPHIGFYGGVNYGYGYTGVGYVGGYWNNGSFMYNTAVTRVNRDRIRNTYSHRVRVVHNDRVSYNGGRGGLNTRPLTSERVASRERHMAPLPAQRTHREEASKNRSQWVSQNHGRPGTMAAAQPLNTGRHAPAATPNEVREQVQREHAGQPPAGRNQARPGRSQPAPRNQARPVQPARTENRPAARPGTRPAARNESHPVARPQNRQEARPAARPQPQPQARPETRSAPRTETRPAARPQNRQEARPAARPEVRQQARPENRSASRNQPQHQEKREQPKKNTDQNPRH